MEYPYLQDLNEAQRNAVLNVMGASLVIAGAGSGKTRVLTFRIAHMLRLGNAPSSILALTFTNKAAREMKDRISTIVGPEVARYLWMGTFHSIFARILRSEAEHIGYPSSFTIYDTADSKSLLKSILRDMQLSDKVYKVGTVLGRISAAKNNLITATAYAQNTAAIEHDTNMRMPLIHRVYKEYTKRCKVSGAMDFDDLLMNTNMLFHQHPEVLKKYQDRFKFILVDEYQDTNYSQYLIVKKLAELHKNLCVVGDDAQSIYSFRGARIENILNFKNDYPGYQTFKLEQNYRSTQTIVEAANSIIKQNVHQIPKNVFSENEPGEKIKVIQAITDNEEGQLVVQELNLHRLNNQMQYSDYAILYRTNAQSRIFEEQLRKLNLPYKIFGGLSFYERKEIKDMLSYLRLTINSNDNEAFKRIINYPARGIGQTTQTKLEETANTHETTMWNVINSNLIEQVGINSGTAKKIGSFAGLINGFKSQLAETDAYEVALMIARQTTILEELYKDKSPESLSKFENVQELLNAIQDFTLNAREEGRPHGLENYLEEVALLSDQDTDKGEDKNRVTLMTVHSSKGLEFKNVFIVGMEDKLFPSSFSGFLTPENLEEERRLFYVALTRAEKQAWLSFAKQRYSWGQLNFSEPSRFIAEIDEQFLNLPSNLDTPSFFDITESSFDKRSYNQTPQQQNRPVTPPTRKPLAQANPQMMQRLTRMQQGAAQPGFTADNGDDLEVGQKVEHQRFGVGTVLELQGTGNDRKATVLFPNAGRKQLLLKFARLKIVR